MSSRRRVVILSCFYIPYVSGAERFVIEVIERLSSQYECIIITARHNRKSSTRENFTGKNGSSYQVVRIGIGSWLLDRWLYMVLAPFVARRMRGDIVHAVMESYAGIALAVFIWLRKGARPCTILTLQSGDLDSEKKQRKIPRWLWRWIHRSPNYITAISSFLASRAVRLGASPDRVSVIPNGVDIERISSVAEAAGPRVPHRVIELARLSWEKAHEYVFEALVIVREKFPDVHLVLVGDGPRKRELESLARRLGVGDVVTFMGALSNEQAIEEVARAEVFVCPSLAEGLGIVFIEAQAAGTPAIGTRVGGIPDVIEDGVTGLLVPPKDSKEIAGAIEGLFSDRVRAERIVTQAKDRLSRFDWDTIARQISSLYERAIPV